MESSSWEGFLETNPSTVFSPHSLYNCPSPRGLFLVLLLTDLHPLTEVSPELHGPGTWNF